MVGDRPGMLARMTTYEQMDEKKTNGWLDVCCFPILMCWLPISLQLGMENTNRDNCPDLYKWMQYDMVIAFALPIALKLLVLRAAQCGIGCLFKMGNSVQSLSGTASLGLGIWGWIVYSHIGDKECLKDPQGPVNPVTLLLVLLILQTIGAVIVLCCTCMVVMAVVGAGVSAAQEEAQTDARLHALRDAERGGFLRNEEPGGL